MNKTELLAPGGSMTGIRAVVAAGADAVYAGGSLFGARAYADNPDKDGILEAIDFCHLHGVKFYLTVNTLLKEQELRRQLYDYILPIYEHGVDAVLVQDLGVFHFLKENFRDLPVHASTQMTVTGAAGAKLLRKMGASRVVLSRELTLDDIKAIRRETDVELETFVHGALCYCYSGQCLMSSLIGGRSGNRGRCAQPCRLPYELHDGFLTAAQDGSGKPLNRKKEDRYLLSLKDICTLQILPDLIAAGIASLKIEGRMKRPEYAAGVTSIYRKYIDLYRSEGRKGFRIDPADLTALTDLFCRGGFSEGYYDQKTGPSMMAMTRPDHSGSMAAKVIQQKRGSVKLRAMEDLFSGDSLQISGKEYLMKTDIPAGKTFRADGYDAAAGDVVMRVRAQHLLDQLSERYVKNEPKVCAEAKISAEPGKRLKMEVSACGKEAMAEGAEVQKADRHPLSEDAVRKQAGRTGDTPFEFRSMDVGVRGDCFIPVSEINKVRRDALARLEKQVLSGFRRTVPLPARPAVFHDPEPQPSAHPYVNASVRSREQLSEVLKSEKVGGVYIDVSMFVYETSEKPEDVIRKVRAAGKKAYLALPFVWRREIEQTFEHFLPPEKVRLFDGILLRSVDQFGRLDDWACGAPVSGGECLSDLCGRQTGFEVIADAGVYTWNTEAQAEVRRLGATWDTCPLECTAKEMEACGSRSSELVIYGRQPLMVTAQCLRKNTSGCTRVPSFMTLTDRRKIRFPVRSECAFCMNIIFNSVPLDLVTAARDREMVSPGSVRYDFTTETGDETKQILRGDMPESITRGHIRKGVE